MANGKLTTRPLGAHSGIAPASSERAGGSGVPTSISFAEGNRSAAFQAAGLWERPKPLDPPQPFASLTALRRERRAPLCDRSAHFYPPSLLRGQGQNPRGRLRSVPRVRYFR